MAYLPPLFNPQFVDSNGAPLSGGQLFTYIGGTTTPLATYTDETGATPNTNPIILDSSGRCDLWLGSGTYKFVLEDTLGNLIKTWDEVVASPAEQITAWAKHPVTNGQIATALTGETVDSSLYIACDYAFQIIRGTTVFASGIFSLQFLNSAWRLIDRGYGGDVHGITWSLTGTTVAQLDAAADSGAGNGTIYLSRTLVSK